MSKPVCMICGSAAHVLRGGQLCLCVRCLDALAGALGDKLSQPPTTQKNVEKPALSPRIP